MFDTIRRNLAISLMPERKSTDKKLNLSSFNFPGMPVYTDLTVRKATRDGYKLSLYVYRAVRTIVQAGSGIPWVILDKNGEIIKNHQLAYVLAHPNPEQSGQDLFEFLIAHLKLVGNALWQPIVLRSAIKELWIVMPDMVRPIPSAVPGQWLSGWEVTPPEGKMDIMPPETFIHFQQLNPGDPYWGIGDLQAAARTVDTDNEAQDTQKVSMQNRGVPSGVFEHTENLTEEQFNEQNRRVQEIYLEKSKRRAPWVLGAGAKWQQMSLTPIEMDYILTRLNNKRDIAAAFGVDPIFLGDKEQSSYNNIIEAKKALYENTVIPLLDDIKSKLNLKIAPIYGDITISYDLSNVTALRDDYNKRIESANKLWQMGVPFEQINSKLELGFKEFDGWDTGYLPFSVTPTGSTTEGKPPASSEPVKKKSLSEEQKTVYWKRIDTRRQSYWALLEKKAIALYKAEGEAVIDAISNQKAVKFSAEQLIAEAREAIEKAMKKWEDFLIATGLALIEDFGKQTAEDIGFSFNPASEAIKKWVNKHAAESVTSILETNLNDVKRIIIKGVEDNIGVRDIGSQLRQFYDDSSAYKAMRIARTETASAAGYGQREAAVQSGVIKQKRWLSSRDDRVRDSHIEIDGEERNLDEEYSNGLMYPGDPSGAPEEIIQCRCVEQYI